MWRRLTVRETRVYWEKSPISSLPLHHAIAEIETQLVGFLRGLNVQQTKQNSTHNRLIPRASIQFLPR